MDDLLARVERPSRYLGNEVNAVKKDLTQVAITVALAYPDLYEIGMSNTGLHILYHMLNEAADVAAERVYLPAADMVALLESTGRPLCTLESRVPLAEVGILGIQIPHELSYANIVKMIRLARIPLWAAARRDEDPIVLGGGPGVFGAEPVAPFYDAMLLGDAEEALWDVVAVVRDGRRRGASRLELLEKLAAITGVYVPRFYEVSYEKDGRVAAIEPKQGAPKLVIKALVEDLETSFYPTKAVVPYAETVHERLPVEVMRGCTVGCRFCQAGMIYRPLRERSPRRILDLAKCGLDASGYEDVSLLSLDTGDYTLIDPLTKDLLAVTAEKRIALSLPSLRAGSLTDDVIHDISRVRRTSFTIAPEAGTQRLRDVINKNISDEEIFETVERVARNGWRDIKMYFMVGFPTETQQDLDGLVDLVTRCRDLGRRFVRTFEATASIGTLVPKPHTPFQWDPQLALEESMARVKYIQRSLKNRRIGCKFHDPRHSWLEGIFSRGDRRLAPVVAAAEARGIPVDSLGKEGWLQAMQDHGLDPEWYLRARGHDEVLPWDHLSARVTKKYLLNDRKKIDAAMAAGKSPTVFDCRDDLCAGCSVCFTDDTRNRLAKYHPDPFGDGRRLPLSLTSRAAVGAPVARQLEGGARPRDQAAKAGADAAEAKRKRRRPPQPGERRWHVTPGVPGSVGPAPVFKQAAGKDDDVELAKLEADLQVEAEAEERAEAEKAATRAAEKAARAAAAQAAREAEVAAALAAGLPAPEALEEQPKKKRGPRPTTAKWEGPVVHYRVGYTRLGALRWLAHREVIRTFYKLLQRSDLPIRYTEGFHPKAKIGFGPPLPVGAESDHEEMDLYLTAELPADEVAARLGPIMAGVPGLSLKCLERGTGRSAHGERLGARWRVDVASVGGTPEKAQAALARWNDLSTPLTIQVDRPDRPRRTVDLRVVISVFEVHDGGATLEFELRSDQGTAKPSEVMAELLGVNGEQARGGRYRLLRPIRKAPDAPVAAEHVDEEPADDA